MRRVVPRRRYKLEFRDRCRKLDDRRHRSSESSSTPPHGRRGNLLVYRLLVS
jgi:hypothetical protein